MSGVSIQAANRSANNEQKQRMKFKTTVLLCIPLILALSACQPAPATEEADAEPSPTSPPSADVISPGLREKSVALSLVAIAENSQTSPVFDYAENIGDGRGITFGIIGFTTGTYDGNEWLHEYTNLNPENRLAKYIPAMDAIDAGPHPDGMNDDLTGLDDFITDFHASLNDPYFKQSQLDKMDELYWDPSVDTARELGIKQVIALSQIFDASIQHGTEGMADIAAQANSALGGSPKDGIDELLWLTRFLDIRREVLSQDPSWNESVDRVEMYRRLLQSGKYSLKTPFIATCYGDTFTVTGGDILP